MKKITFFDVDGTLLPEGVEDDNGIWNALKKL